MAAGPGAGASSWLLEFQLVLYQLLGLRAGFGLAGLAEAGNERLVQTRVRDPLRPGPHDASGSLCSATAACSSRDSRTRGTATSHGPTRIFSGSGPGSGNSHESQLMTPHTSADRSCHGFLSCVLAVEIDPAPDPEDLPALNGTDGTWQPTGTALADRGGRGDVVRLAGE